MEHTQLGVNSLFNATAQYWDDIYDDTSLQAEVYRARERRVLELVRLASPVEGSLVLEVGVGSGRLAMLLADQGLKVQAIDSSEQMLATARERAQRFGVLDQISLAQGDAHALDFPDGSFTLVVAIGVLPWLHDPRRAIGEFYRVLAPRSQLILTSDNRARLVSFIDPRAALAATPLRQLVIRQRLRRGLATSRMDYRGRVRRMLSSSGFKVLEECTVGFGPIQLLGRRVFSEERGIAIHRHMQRLADADVPVVRSLGWHSIFRAVKS
jgi:ubiquinone/menaquinone biosynthesis C-methylase UbiE